MHPYIFPMAYDLDPEMLKAVDSFVRSQFANDSISKIEIEPAGEMDGETILNVRVIFLRKQETAGLRDVMRKARPTMNRFNAFPVFSFSTQHAPLGAAA